MVELDISQHAKLAMGCLDLELTWIKSKMLWPWLLTKAGSMCSCGMEGRELFPGSYQLRERLLLTIVADGPARFWAGSAAPAAPPPRLRIQRARSKSRPWAPRPAMPRDFAVMIILLMVVTMIVRSSTQYIKIYYFLT